MRTVITEYEKQYNSGEIINIKVTKADEDFISELQINSKSITEDSYKTQDEAVRDFKQYREILEKQNIYQEAVTQLDNYL